MRWELFLDYQRPDGSTKRQHYTAILERTGVPDSIRQMAEKALAPPYLRPSARYLLLLFYELNGTRRQGQFGWERLSWVELEAYLRLTRTELAPWEVKLIKLMDNAWFSTAMEAERDSL